MPPKRAKNKSKAHKETEKVDDAKDVKGAVLDHKILLNPAFKLEEIIERGSAATMKSWSAIVTDNLNWLQSQKAALKELIRNAGAPEKSVPKTPRRGAAVFARLRETADSYTSYSLVFEDKEAEQEDEENDEQLQTISQACTATVAVNNDVVVEADGEMQPSLQAQVESSSNAQLEEFFEVEPQQVEAESESSYEDAHNSIHHEPANHEEPEQELAAVIQQRNVEDSTCTTETYVSARGSAERLPQLEYITHVKTECVTPPEPQPMLQKTLCPSTSGETASNSEATPIVSAEIKREIPSSREEHAQRCAIDVSTEPQTRVSRSTTRAKAAAAKTPSRHHYGYDTIASSSRNQNLRAVAPTPHYGEEPRAAAGASHTRIAKVVHEHIVTTPCKRQYKSAVRRVMEDQELARTLSPKRATVPTPSRTRAAAKDSRADTKAAAKARAEALRKEKEEKAAQLREEQCRERAERLRKEREEKQLRAKRRRHEKEVEEKQKAEALKKKEELEDRRREEYRLHKSPARSNAVSRVNSPSRLPKIVASQPRTASKALFVSTPGRVPSKIARVQEKGGATTREPTMNTPSRETRRKPYPSRLARQNSGDSAGRCLWSPKEEVLSQDRLFEEVVDSPHTKERCDQVKKLAAEHRQKLRHEEEERKRIRQAREERQNLAVPKMEVDDFDECDNLNHALPRVLSENMRNCHLGTGEDDRGDWEEERCRLDVEAEEVMQEEDHYRQEEENRRRRLSEEERKARREHEEALAQELLEAERRRKEEEEERFQEEQRRKLEEEQMQEAEARTKEQRRLEEEEAKARLNVSSSAELFNRHLANVSLNTSNVENRSPSRNDSHSSYEMTPDKKYKPASENDYNIEDLSSGDETDQEDAPRKKVPAWAEGDRLKRSLERRVRDVRTGNFDPNTYFGEIEAPDLTLIFGNTKRYPRRGSSGLWESPISKPRQGVGAYQNRMNRKY